MMKYLLMAIAVIGLFAYLLQLDEELSPLAKKWVATIEEDTSGTSEAFLYLNGIMAAEDEDVLLLGTHMFNSYQQAAALMQPFDENIEFETYPEEQYLAKPNNEDTIYCQLQDIDCFNVILNNIGLWDNELNQYSTLLLRYQTFIAYTEYKTLIKPSIIEPFPLYDYLMLGNRLALLQSLKLAEQGSIKQSIKKLTMDIGKLRIQLAASDQLVHKMIFVALIANNLDAIVHISKNYAYQQSLNIPLLTESELSIEKPIIREFTGTYYLNQSLDGNPEILEQGGNISAWIVRILYKPNKTNNDMVPEYQRSITFSQLTAEQFAKAKSTPFEAPINSINYLNLVGSTLNMIANPDYLGYTARLFDLSSKISLVNAVVAGEQSEFDNPYYPSRNAYTIQHHKLCLDGPYKDDLKLRCVTYSN